MTTVVTFDLFSALLDSRAGGCAAFDQLAGSRGWAVSGEALYDRWDAHNKAAQRDCTGWVPWRDPAAAALRRTYAELDVVGAVPDDLEVLVNSMADWPLWPDVAPGLPLVAAGHRIGLLSNVDDEVFARTAAAPLVDADVALTSQRLQAYKPHAAIYLRARDSLGSMVHVAASARDVRGALEAGIPVVRLRRPGHELDPDGPAPTHEVDAVADLAPVITSLA